MRTSDTQYYDTYTENYAANVGRIFTSALIGGLIGAAVALLMAPVTGQELRRTIREEFDNAQDRARSLVGDAEARGREVVEGIKEDVGNLKENIKDTAQKRTKSISKVFGR